jgi:trk system potassium uptake protein TrkA
LLLGLEEFMFVVIAGSGRLGVGLAQAMSTRQDDVVVIDEGLTASRLGENFDGVIVDGDPMDLDVLTLAGIGRADLFLAVTGNDNVNIFCAQAAHTCFGVREVLARIADPEKEAFYRKFGLDTVCPTITGINQVLEAVSKDRFSSIFAFVDPNMICVHPLEEWIGKKFSQIEISQSTKVAGLVRSGRFSKLFSKDAIRRDDTLLVARK